MSNGQPPRNTPRLGKFRGKILSTEDPEMSGRLLCEVPSLPGMLLNWATPAVPYAGLEQGMFALPEEGADVWIEFEEGNPDRPIWSGGYWEKGLEPLMPELAPEMPELVNVLRSKCTALVMNDTPEEGGFSVSVTPPAVDVPVKLTIDSLGFSVVVGELSLKMNPESGITLTAGESVFTLSPETASTEAPTIEMEADSELSITAPESSIEGDLNVTGPVEVEGPVEIAEEATVAGELSVAGAAELAGEVNVSGALTAEGEANFAGALTAEGDANFAGAVEMEGDLAVLGAQETVGNNATAGLIEGIVVPPGI